jgi:hypothetical protein
MNHAQKRVVALLGLLSEEMWSRAGRGEFSLLDHMTKPGDYRPTTTKEKEVWNELTQPDLRAELIRYLQPAIDAGDPASEYYKLILKDSAERASVDSAKPSGATG